MKYHPTKLSPKMDTECGKERGWPGIEQASPFALKKKSKKASVDARRWSSVGNALVVALIMTMPPIVLILSGRLGAPSVLIQSTVARLGAQRVADSKKDVLLDGLLLPGFDEQSCASRYQSVYYRKNMTRSPTPYLIKRLREQEALQRRCGPGTEPYRKASERLKSGQKDVETIEGCSYLLLLSYRGLGNRVLATVSAFLYAVLTNRVLLVDRGKTMGDLFCEPFPGTTWLLPLDFPLQGYKDLGEDAAESYGNVTLRGETGPASAHRFVYMHLDHAASKADRLVYCDDHRQFLHRVQWVVMRSDGYNVPGFFLNPAYQEELHKMFPRKDSVFYVLSRYLLHPTDDVWGMVTRFHDAYLKNGDERLGIQVRVFDYDDVHFQHILDQILACTSQERLLPGVAASAGPAAEARHPTPARSKAVLMTGLNSWYHDSIREMYWRSPSADGQVVSVHQPSHEEHQSFGQSIHDMKALAEMYLLSMTDRIVTSGWSTFGYVSTALGGLTPYIMMKPEGQKVPDTPCKKAMSMEPCAQGPPYFDCTRKENTDAGNLVPHVRACEDMLWGLKLTEPVTES